MTRDQSFKTKFSKMTFACLSQATATSARVFHQTQNTFNRIQNTFITDEIHDQGNIYIFLAKFVVRFSFCFTITGLVIQTTGGSLKCPKKHMKDVFAREDISHAANARKF